MRCYLVTWDDIYGRTFRSVVVASCDVVAERFVPTCQKDFRQILKCVYLTDSPLLDSNK